MHRTIIKIIIKTRIRKTRVRIMCISKPTIKIFIDGWCNTFSTFNSIEYYGTYGDENAPLYFVEILESDNVLRIDRATRDGYISGNMCKKISTDSPMGMRNNEIRTETNSSPTKIYMRFDTDPNISSENPLIIVVEIKTPITYQLTPTEVRLLLGTNNLWVDTGNILEMTYPCDLKLYIDKKISQITPTNVSTTRTEHDFSAAQEVFDALQKIEITDAEEPEEER